ncbi:MAG: Mrp/NBP35 family ATP-binding protein [Rikenellaceae bacterium]
MKQEIEEILGSEGKIIGYIEGADGACRVVVELKNGALKKAMQRAIEELFRDSGVMGEVEVREAQRDKPKTKYAGETKIKRIIAVASGKGGVGKSSVAAALARSLAARGESVGILDADIYGPSQPKLMGMEGEMPEALADNMMVPPLSAEGIKVMSIGYFVTREEALVWRGPMATTALKQLIHQSQWGEIDTLVLDMPPGTGDIHLTLAAELKITSAVIVTTPSDLALADVIRGVSMLKNENVAIPIAGIVNNMAYFSPSDMPEKRYEIFGDSKSLEQIAQQNNLKVLCEVPITQRFGEALSPALFSEVL